MAEIAVIVPLYNRAWAIGDCLHSLAGVDRDRIEVAVIDDGSTDGSAEAARRAVVEMRAEDWIQVREQPNAGPGAARNRGAATTTAPWLVFLDSDDMWFPWTGPLLLNVLGAYADRADIAFYPHALFSDADEVARMAAERDAPGTVRATLHPSFHAAVGKAGLRLGASNAAMRRQPFEAASGFTEEVYCAEDTDLWLRAGGPTLMIAEPELIALRGQTEESLTGNLENVVTGLNWKIARHRQGKYAGSNAELVRFLGQSLVWAIVRVFRLGRPNLAYGLYLRHLPLLVRARQWRYLWRLPLWPLLSVLRPAHYAAPPDKRKRGASDA